MPTIVIIGAGPAGMRAAETICRAGLIPILIDEAPRAGGQGYRTPAPGIVIDTHKLMGSQSKNIKSFISIFWASFPALTIDQKHLFGRLKTIHSLRSRKTQSKQSISIV